MFLSVLLYQIIHFTLQYLVLKRKELIYYSLFLLSAAAFYFIYQTAGFFHIFFPSVLNTIFNAVQMSFAFIQNYFYITFVLYYLSLKNTKYRVFYLLKYYKVYNFAFIFIFIGLGFLKIESQNLFGMISLLTVPISIVLVVMIWRLKIPYSNIVSLGIVCNITGAIASYILILNENYEQMHLPFTTFFPSQLGMLIDIIILGYGLSLKAAESDKKLVIALQANQKLIEDERNRVARDLHDGLGGLLSGVKLSLLSITGNIIISDQHAAAFKRVLFQLDNAISEMRRVAHSMMPESLLRFGLVQATEDFCYDINESKMVQLNFYHHGLEQRLDSSAEITLFRVIQELVNNAIKHAAATNVMIHLVRNENQLILTVEDNGTGFDINNIKKSKGVGLSNIQSRINFLKGNLEIESKQDIGTSFYITIPV
ncbi:MAG: sensor histidine kinase [Chitinophagales bacterium]|nr:sensor histidine kinase [Chitinophagales bacterium]